MSLDLTSIALYKSVNTYAYIFSEMVHLVNTGLKRNSGYDMRHSLLSCTKALVPIFVKFL